MDDSVYLMMLERNGDLVKLASYAPLFCNVNLRDWGVNLIEFDSSRSFAHASYYVQKVFNENRPDVNLATTVDVEPKPDANRPLMAGKFGLGSWNTLISSTATHTSCSPASAPPNSRGARPAPATRPSPARAAAS